MLEKILKKIARMHTKYPIIVILVCLLITVVAVNGVFKIETESNIEKWMPQDMPVVQTTKLIRSIFGGSDLEMIVVRQDKNSMDEYAVNDVRDPGVLRAIDRLELRLRDEAHIYSVYSIVDSIKQFNHGEIPGTKGEVNGILSMCPEAKEYMANDYSSTIVVLMTDAGSDQRIAGELVSDIKESIEESAFPSGIDVDVTGIPSLMWELMGLMNENNKKTTIACFIGVIIVLLIVYTSVRWGLIPLIPLVFGVIWMLGSLGYLGIPFSMATSAVTSMMVGMGIAYGIHLVDRYKEEREKNTIEQSLETSVVSIGSAILSTSLTTMGGFIALIFGSIPMIQQLGMALAISILCAMCAAIFLLPSMLYVLEKGGLRYVKESFI